ncbi:division plane positioning ATPase MipZ [Paracoccus aerodenitrificans]|uniref:division plane positioning ATPase MipZ n=1 Tax=Paracoccus aerodenitrificans TaxID=3017781 RepID=UPI0022F11C03|nr:division plane positioning ATPase MipZ [Paracoccus aerodenitrificans]WBU65200.1 AAA family ATPase [Paracoccus aerodenitrificans]
MAHIIVVGNEKGGSGKSTTSMHVATALARMGHRVAALDLDIRQRSFGRYLENRAHFIEKEGLDLPTPTLGILEAASPNDTDPLSVSVSKLDPEHDFLLIDCPGSHTRLAQMAHMLADTLITPLNDSFIDFDLLARMSPDGKILGPSIYAEMVWGARQGRQEAGAGPIDWIVLRNRLGTQQMHNKRKVGTALTQLSKRIGFRVAPGFAERVIFRELFPRGLTLLDLKDIGTESLSMSNIAARQELRELIATLALPGVKVDF